MSTDHSPAATDARRQMLDRVRTLTRGPIAPKGRRRALAFGYLAAVGVAAVGALVPDRTGTLVSGVGVVAGIVLLGRLRKAVRWVADAPSEALDDLFRRIQGECYVAAYQLLGALVVVSAAVLLLVGASPSSSGLSPVVAELLGWLLLGVAMGGPVVVTALTLPDAGPADPA